MTRPINSTPPNFAFQSYVRSVSHGHEGQRPAGCPDHHLLPMDHFHRRHRGHRARPHHPPGGGHGEGQPPRQLGACDDFGRCSAGPHQVNAAHPTREVSIERIVVFVCLIACAQESAVGVAPCECCHLVLSSARHFTSFEGQWGPLTLPDPRFEH